ncbi:helix-turn-helix domain-containing protein [Massilibacteroides vaginae]|uniref:helix-turn-helix domain-containing protein n=1 Tax=Massilibacteroides vaginae TaxID=1673718 RepID=UPI000A1CBD12|nr:helix-turn-helix transcriptional regulator [Massilibacteroides vaginae]
MQTNNHKIVDYDAVLDAKFGANGTPSRIEAEEKAYVFYTGQIIEDARKKAKMTQSELAELVGTNKSYISRVETGRTEPKVSTFFRIISALGLSVDLKPSNA